MCVAVGVYVGVGCATVCVDGCLGFFVSQVFRKGRSCVPDA